MAADTGGAGGFKTLALNDGATAKSDHLFCVNTNITGTANAYDGSDADFELIVPVPFGSTETYYFYVELN